LRDGDDLEVGYILPQQAWGKGYATEIAEALIEYGLNTLGLERLIATVDAGHVPSLRVLEKTGMSIRERVEDPDGLCLVYGINRTDYKGSGQPHEPAEPMTSQSASRNPE
jgi:RimJ/RimL family protein N-acetyltransferase